MSEKIDWSTAVVGEDRTLRVELAGEASVAFASAFEETLRANRGPVGPSYYADRVALQSTVPAALTVTGVERNEVHDIKNALDFLVKSANDVADAQRQREQIAAELNAEREAKAAAEAEELGRMFRAE